MSFSRVYAAQPHMLKGKVVTVEVDITKGTLHAFTMVGLPDKAVDEAKDRMSSALKNSGFNSPKNQNQKIVISLSPLLLCNMFIEYQPNFVLVVSPLRKLSSIFPSFILVVYDSTGKCEVLSPMYRLQ